jgi:PilZ domain
VATRGTSDSRASPRREGRGIPVHILHGMHQAEPLTGTVLDLSDGGLGLMVKKSYPPSTMLSIRPASAGDDIPWVLVEVRHCRQTGRTYRIGCKFVRSPSYGVLVLFDRTSN